jgi:hypothetical protein
MPVTVVEKFDSRHLTTGVGDSFDSASLDLNYTIFGTDSEAEAQTALAQTVPLLYGLLKLQTVSVQPLGEHEWDGTAHYVSALKAPSAGDEPTWTFDTSGGTQHITVSKETTHRCGRFGDTAPDTKNMIGATEDHVAGCDITIPVYSFSETHHKTFAFVDNTYKGTLFRLTGKVCNAAFKGCAAGECLFLGATGSRRGANPFWEITYKFAASPNVTSITIGDITVPAKKGWEYLWTRSRPEVVDSGGLGKSLWMRPWYAYTERVYEEADFADLQIGT